MRSAIATTPFSWSTKRYAGDLESLASVAHRPGYSFVRADIVDAAKMGGMIESFEPDAPIVEGCLQQREGADDVGLDEGGRAVGGAIQAVGINSHAQTMSETAATGPGTREWLLSAPAGTTDQEGRRKGSAPAIVPSKKPPAARR
jgi:hypothetical protein